MKQLRLRQEKTISSEKSKNNNVAEKGISQSCRGMRGGWQQDAASGRYECDNVTPVDGPTRRVSP